MENLIGNGRNKSKKMFGWKMTSLLKKARSNKDRKKLEAILDQFDIEG